MNHFMAAMILFGFTICTVVGCSAAANVTYLGDSNNVDTISTPVGFEITPKEADQVRIQQSSNSIAVHHIYADGRNYYICDGFFGSKSNKAVNTGLAIDGKTGDVIGRGSDK